MITRADLIDVLFVIVPHSLLLDIAGPAEAFRLANQHREARGLSPRFRLRFAGPVSAMPTSVGLGLVDLAPLPQRLSARTWVVVVGQPTVHTRQVTPSIAATAQWLTQKLRDTLRDADTPHRLITICSGTLLAARAGLLATRRCTTHHELLHDLRALAPRAQVIDNRVFVVDGPLASSAGITAGIDVALHLIAEECGEALAASVAEDMVVYLRRSPRDPSCRHFTCIAAICTRPCTGCRTRSSPSRIATGTWRRWRRWATPPSVTCCGCFIEHAGVSPLHYLRSIRLERARQSLEYGASVTRAAEVAGFPVGAAVAARVESAVGRVAARCGAGGGMAAGVRINL